MYNRAPNHGHGTSLSAKSIVLFFVKAPVVGLVKSRLGASVGDEAALDLYRNFVLDTLDTLKTGGLPLAICHYPRDAGRLLSSWLGGRHRLIPQEGDDLGARMENAFKRVFSEGFTRALLIGSDIPDLPQALFHEAFGRLESCDAAIGEAADGGYYLIGFNRDSFLPRTFQGMQWSTRTVFRETLARFKEASLRVHHTGQWRDVDTLDDLQALFERNRSSDFALSRTMEYLRANKGRLFPEATHEQ